MRRSILTLLFIFIVIFLITLIYAAEDYYAILGVTRDATQKQIKKAYKELSLKYHPDRNPNDKTASERFMKLANAYEVLSDNDKKRIYDQYGEEGLKKNANQHADFHDPFDIFSRFTGNSKFNFQNQKEEKRGPDISLEIDVTLEDLYIGRMIEVGLDKQILCPKCGGSGAKNFDDVQTCPVCNGQGVKVVRQNLGPGFSYQTQTTCDKCGGKGKITKSKCPYCSGKKVVRGQNDIIITIERGMADGQQIPFEQEADQHPDHTAGNVIFTIRTASHPRFQRKGNNLYVRTSITLLESLVGFEKEIQHLDNHTVHIKRSSVTKPAFVQLIKGEGMPHHETPSVKGDLEIEYYIEFPSGELPEAKKIQFKELLAV